MKSLCGVGLASRTGRRGHSESNTTDSGVLKGPAGPSAVGVLCRSVYAPSLGNEVALSVASQGRVYIRRKKE
jgi:hypothetical protein